MKFTVPFEKDIYEKQAKLQFDYVWRENLKKSWKGLIIGFLLTALGVFFITQKSLYGIVLTIIGSIYLYKFYEFHLSYKSNKTRFFDESEKYIEDVINQESISTWEFEEDYFKYTDKKCELKIDWSYFKNYEIFQENLFLNTTHANISYVLGKEEIEEEEFNELIKFLDSKLKRIED